MKQGGAKKAKKKEDNDESTQNIMKFYIRKINSIGVASNKHFTTAVAEAIENQGDLNKLHIIDEIGPNACKGIFEALADLNYKHLTDIWLVKAGLGDEGAKVLSAYMEKVQVTKVLDLTENEIGAIGCHHIGMALSPLFRVPIMELTLDFNPIACQGLEQLAKGLIMNTTLRKLSLNYCHLDLESVKYLQEILSFVDCDIRYLNLEGNFLRNEGQAIICLLAQIRIYQLFRALETNGWLEELNVANNQFGECEDIPVVEKICEVLTKNNSIQVYDLRGNAIYDDCKNFYIEILQKKLAIRKFLECIKMYKTVCRFEIPFQISQAILEELKKVTKKRKRKKNKKKKNKKKKKSKA